jgi:hypothetical protein
MPRYKPLEMTIFSLGPFVAARLPESKEPASHEADPFVNVMGLRCESPPASKKTGSCSSLEELSIQMEQRIRRTGTA